MQEDGTERDRERERRMESGEMILHGHKATWRN